MGRLDRDDHHASKGIDRARSGDPDALAVLYVRYRDRVQAYVQSIVRDPHQAEDVTQQVFAGLAAALGSYEERPAAFSAWLLRVARNAALDHLRARRRAPEAAEPVDRESYDGDLGRTACLREALEGLPCEQRRVFLMRELLGMSPSEVARRLGKTEGSVHAMHHRGRTSLRRRLGELGVAPMTHT